MEAAITRHPSYCEKRPTTINGFPKVMKVVRIYGVVSTWLVTRNKMHKRMVCVAVFSIAFALKSKILKAEITEPKRGNFSILRPFQ